MSVAQSIDGYIDDATDTRLLLSNDADFGRVLDDLGYRNISRLMVEGGHIIHTRFLTAGLANEIHLAVATFFVGDSKAPKFVGSGMFPRNSAHRMEVAEEKHIGDVVLIRYLIDAGRQ